MGETIIEATEAGGCWSLETRGTNQFPVLQAASQTALQLAVSNGLSGSDAANAAAAHGVSCRFIWTTDPSVSLTPVGIGVGNSAAELCHRCLRSPPGAL